jgi:hypothetical protein
MESCGFLERKMDIGWGVIKDKGGDTCGAIARRHPMENKISESIWGMLLRISLFLLPCATTQQKQQTIIDPQGDEFRTNLGTVGVAPPADSPRCLLRVCR